MTLGLDEDAVATGVVSTEGLKILAGQNGRRITDYQLRLAVEMGWPTVRFCA